MEKYKVKVKAVVEKEFTIEAQNDKMAEVDAARFLKNEMDLINYNISSNSCESVSLNILNEIKGELFHFLPGLERYCISAIVTETKNIEGKMIEYIYLDCNEKYHNANYCAIRIDGQLFVPSYLNGDSYPMGIDDARTYLWYRNNKALYFKKDFNYILKPLGEMHRLYSNMVWLNKHHNGKGIVLTYVNGVSELEYELYEDIVKGEISYYTAIYEDMFHYYDNIPLRITETFR